MKTYTAFFYSDANYAEHEIEAETPEEALATARSLDKADDGSLYFESCDQGQPVDEITIRDEAGDDLATWLSDELRLRLAARDLLDALKLVLQPYGELLQGVGADLADCVKYQTAIAAIAKAEPNDAP
jgi:hypothetical protein